VTWELLWAFGRYDLRLSEEQFWALTPREYALLADRCEARTKWEDMRAALAPWMMNLLWATKKGRVELDELMVFNMMRGAAEKPQTTPEEESAKLQNRINTTFGMLVEAARAQKR
jgi:hypothetical protein